ncbi:MAG: phosphatase PAP2 family protein [Bdellovibrio sp.]|nr:phosphatase PAP2 family protein [Bdellovibrio sp.]
MHSIVTQLFYSHFRTIFTITLGLATFAVKANDCGKFLDNFTSPVCTDAKYIFWTGTALTISLRIVKKNFETDVQNQAIEKNHLRQWGAVGDTVGFGYLNGAYILGQMLFGGTKGNARAEHMFESSFYTLGVTYGLKQKIHETRPGFPTEHDSFPSGHSSFSFAFASVVTANHGLVWGGLAHLTAVFISFSRINDNWHYMHDVVAGMTIGLSYGWGVYFNHRKYHKPYWIGFLPTADLKGGQLALNYRF